MKVFITRDIPRIAYNLLKKNNIGFEVYEKDKSIPHKLLLEKIKNVDGLITLLTEKISKKVIDSMNKCKVIANYAVGYNNIDVEYAKQKNIIVTNTPNVLTESTADLTVALILSCSRKLFEAENLIRKKQFKGWKPKLLLGIELKNKTVGLIGAGRIGMAVGIRVKAFGTNIIYFDSNRNKILEENTAAKKVSLKFLLENSDIISVHLPLNENTYHFLNKENLSQVKKTAIIVNTSRGEIIDEKYLIKMLKKNRIKSAGLDVYENEPGINIELLKMKNVVLLPHIGSATEEARSAMAELAAKNIIGVLKNNKPITPVI